MSYDPSRPAARLLLTPEDKEAPARTERLRRLGLGEHPEPALDVFAGRLAERTATPYAMVNLPDDKGQFYAGLHVPPARPDGAPHQVGRRLPRDHGYCPHVLVRRKALALEDVRDFPRFAGNAIVDGYGIHSYLGAPLIDSTGTALGTVSVADVTPRTWGQEGLATIKRAAGELVVRLERGTESGLPL